MSDEVSEGCSGIPKGQETAILGKTREDAPVFHDLAGIAAGAGGMIAGEGTGGTETAFLGE